MNLALFDDYKPGVVVTDRGKPGIVDASALVGVQGSGQEVIEALIIGFEELRAELEELGKAGSLLSLASVRLRAPTPAPTNVLGMRVNYREGTSSAGPLRAFAVSPGSILDPYGTTRLPPIEFVSCRHEAELVAVIGKVTDHVPENQVMSHVFGYMTGVDIGIFHKDDWGPFGKSCTGFKPIGPWIVTADEIPDPENLQVRLTVSGELRQDYNTSDIAHPVCECVSWLSSFMALQPGDILFMGTNHQQVGPLQHGDQVELTIERIGSLDFDIYDPLGRVFEREILADVGQRAIAEKDSFSH